MESHKHKPLTDLNHKPIATRRFYRSNTNNPHHYKPPAVHVVKSAAGGGCRGWSSATLQTVLCKEERIFFFSCPFLLHPVPRRGLPPPPYVYLFAIAVRRGSISRPDWVGGGRAAVPGHLIRLPIHVFG